MKVKDRPKYSKWRRKAGGVKVCPNRECRHRHKPVMRIEGTAVRPKNCIKCGRALPGNPVRISPGQQPAKGCDITFTGAATQAPAQMIRRPDYPADGGKIDGSVRICQGLFTACRLYQIQPDTHIGIGPAGIKSNHITFTEQGCEITCGTPLAQIVRRQHHVSQPGV